MNLRGAVVVVTGASSGIGWVTAEAFAAAGAHVVLAARREDRLQQLASIIERRGGTAGVVRCDVSRREEVEALAEAVRDEHGRADVLVNNAGIPGGGSFARLPVEDMERIVATNLMGVLYGTKAFLPMMLEAGRGHIVNVASLAGRYAIPGAAVYAATKHAVVAFSESLDPEVAPKGVRVTSVNPGLVPTEGFPHSDVRQRRPFLITPAEQVARTIVDVVRRGKAPEVAVPRWLAMFQAFRILTPQLYRYGLARAARSGVRATGVGETRSSD